MKTPSRLAVIDICLALVTFTGFTLFTMHSYGEIGPWYANKPEEQIVLDVVNTHFTIGKKIPSIYLRVFANGTAECHSEKYTEMEKDVVRTRHLGAEDFQNLKAVIDEPNLSVVNKRYGRRRVVVDSWMEWNITIRRPSGEQQIEVASFSPESARGRNQPYPDALVDLGCSILKIRNDVYGDAQDSYNVECSDRHPTR